MSEPARHFAEVEIQVQFYDVDALQVVWHGHYAKYFEHARCALLDSIGYGYAQMRDSGFAWPVIDLHVRYAQPAVLGQRIIVRAELVEWEQRLRIEYPHHRRGERSAAEQREHDAGRGEHGDAGDVLRVAAGPVREDSGSRRMTRAALSAIALLVVAARISAQDSAALARIQRQLASPAIFCGTFEQSKALVGVKQPVKSSGRFCVSAGKGILWRTLRPFPTSLLVTREGITESRAGEAPQRLSAQQEPGVRAINDLLFSLFGGDLSRLATNFAVSADRGRRELERRRCLRARRACARRSRASTCRAAHTCGESRFTMPAAT